LVDLIVGLLMNDDINVESALLDPAASYSCNIALINIILSYLFISPSTNIFLVSGFNNNIIKYYITSLFTSVRI
jgi:hypothetical protein